MTTETGFNGVSSDWFIAVFCAPEGKEVQLVPECLKVSAQSNLGVKLFGSAFRVEL